MSDWTAYCAPGLRAYAEIVLALKGEDVTSVEESRALRGSDIILVNQAVIEEAFKPGLPFGLSDRASMLPRSPLDPLRMLGEDMARSSLREHSRLLVTGI